MTEIVLLAIVVIITVLYLLEKAKSEALQKNYLEQAEQKSFGIIHKAMDKAQSILGLAEIESIKVVADSTVKSRKLEQSLEQDFQKEFNLTTQNIQENLKAYLGHLEQSSDQSQKEILESTKVRVNQMMDRFEQNLSQFLAQTEQQSISSLELEMRSARQMIEFYKQQQLAVIDENVVAMLEQTLSLVLSKKLTLRDHLDLIFEALDRAKLEKFVI